MLAVSTKTKGVILRGCQSKIVKTLVSYTLYNHISLSQTKFSYGEGHETRRVGLEAMPLHQHIEGRHGEGQPCLNIRPAPMYHLLHMALRHEVARLIVCCDTRSQG